MKEKLKTNLISISFTIVIIGLLILSGPAKGQNCNSFPGYGYGYGYGDSYGYGYSWDPGYGYGYGSSYNCEPIIEEPQPVSAPNTNIGRFLRGITNPEIEVKELIELIEAQTDFIKDNSYYDDYYTDEDYEEEDLEVITGSVVKEKGFISKVFSSIGSFFGWIFGWLLSF